MERVGAASAALLIVLLYPAGSASAQNVRPLPVDDMSRQAQVIGVATVVSAIPHVEPRNGFVYTDFRLNFSEVWKGDAGPAFILTKPGGTVGTNKGSVPGHEYVLKPGEQIVVFATPSDLGNHVPIGIHQGLYRIGKDEASSLYRVTQFPFGPGKTSSLTLQSLKDEVYRSLGKPLDSRPGPDRAVPAPLDPDKKAHSPIPDPAPAPETTPTVPREAAPPEPPRGIAFLLVCLLLAAVGGVLFLKRKPRPPG
jgi:hypothetical protein